MEAPFDGLLLGAMLESVNNIERGQLVQAFYREKLVNLPLIAKEGFLTVFGPGTCPL